MGGNHKLWYRGRHGGGLEGSQVVGSFLGFWERGGWVMKFQVGRGGLLGSLILLIFIAGMALAIAFASPKTFWTNVGFMLSGTSIGVGAAVLIIKRLLDDSQAVERDRSKRILLRTLGHDCIGAIGRIFGQIGSNNFKFKGEELNDAWYYGIETGQLSPDGFHSNLVSELSRATYGEDPRKFGNPPPLDHFCMTPGLILM